MNSIKNWLIILSIICASSARAMDQDTNFVHSYVDDQSIFIRLPDSQFTSVWHDTSGIHEIEDILNANSIDFSSKKEDQITTSKSSVWVKFKLRNTSQFLRNEVIKFCEQADSVWLYAVDDGNIVSVQKSATIAPPKYKNAAVFYSTIDVSLDPGQSKSFYVQFKFRAGTSSIHFDHIFIETRQTFIQRIVETYMIQSFYVGIMLLFTIVSIFMFISFKERIFIYFGFLTLFFALYFLKLNGIADAFILYSWTHTTISILSLFISGIVTSLSLFLIRYVKLKDHFPQYLNVYIVIIVVTALISHVTKLLSVSSSLKVILDNSMILVWIVMSLFPLVILTRKGDKSSRIILVSMGFLAIGSVLFVLRLLKVLPKNFLTLYGMQIGTVIFSGVLFYGLFDKLNAIRKERFLIKVEKEKSDILLMNVLPAEIAEELKETGETPARKFDHVSILFTDFKGFTQQSEKMSATDLVEELHQCFRAFDDITEKYGIEKIKTIGDAYMAAGGLPIPSDVSVRNTIMAGLEMQRFITERETERRAKNKISFQMRVGIHTGHVVAGVVGVKKFQYDIWGDAVNTASRMESSGAVGRVNISESTYELIKSEKEFECKSRGKIEAKGKGEVGMWFVQRNLSS
jgi:class 3 adenylate cyclase